MIATATRRLDFEDPATFAPALAGVGRVFLMRPPHISDTRRYLRPFVRAMEAAGVAMLSAALGRLITYQPVGLLAYHRDLWRRT